MATRSNACSELTRFWLEARHGCLVGEGIPVKVPYALSDIDLVALHPLGHTMTLPTGATIGPRLIIETKDEHDWDPSGREFGALLRADVAKMGDWPFVPRGSKQVKFSMLREEHYERAITLFGNDDFDRLFVVHAIDPGVLADLGPISPSDGSIGSRFLRSFVTCSAGTGATSGPRRSGIPSSGTSSTSW